MSIVVLTSVHLGDLKSANLPLGGILGCLIGCGFLFNGLTRKPLEFNPFNPWKKPLSVRTARIVYIPAAVLCFLFGLRDIIHALR